MNVFTSKAAVSRLQPGTVLNAIIRGTECTRIVAKATATKLEFTNGSSLYLDGPGLRIKDGRLQSVAAATPDLPGNPGIPERVLAEYWPA